MPYLHSHYHLARMQEMGKVYWCHGISVFGSCLATIFVPIFLLKSGFTFQSVLLYILSQQAFALALQYPTASVMERIRPHYILAIGVLFHAFFFGLLGTMHLYHWPLWYLALIWAFNRTFYWTAFHYLFGLARAHEKAGRQIAGINVLSTIATTLAPAIGGVIASLYGINYIYSLAVVLLIAAVRPMLDKDAGPSPVKINMSLGKIWQMRRDVMANMCNGTLVMAENNMWPMLVYILITSYAGIGLLSSVIAISSVALTVYVGRRQDSLEDRHFLGQGLATYSVTSIGRAIVQNSGQVFGLNLLGGVGRSLYVTPFMNKYYSNSDGEHRLGYITMMEGAFSLGSLVYLAALLALSATFSMQTVLSIALAAIAILVAGVRLIR